MAENGLPSDVELGIRKELSVIDIPDDLENLLSEAAFGPELCIYHVPRKLRAINPEAYTPRMMSIGPFHHQDKALMPMHATKLRYLAGFCQRTRTKWTELANLIEKQEEKIRNCYDEKFQESGKPFRNMILLDSVFIIEFFLRRKENAKLSFHGREEAYKHDYILGKPTREHALLEDLILLENQLPYFVLEDVYTFVTNGQSDDFLPLVKWNLSYYLDPPKVEEDHGKYCCSSFDCFSCCYCFCLSCEKNDNQDELVRSDPKEKPLHFTDLIRKARAYPRPLQKKSDDTVESLYSASKLEDAGVKLRVDPKAWPLNLRFNRGELKMPRFQAQNDAERILRNLMAYEQCHHPNHPYICDYIRVLDFLINTEHDVEVLVQNDVVVNLLGSSGAVADLVNKLCAEISASGACYYDTVRALNNHCDNTWRRAVAIMKSVYFTNLWRGTGTVAAAILLLLTLVQSIYSIMKMFP